MKWLNYCQRRLQACSVIEECSQALVTRKAAQVVLTLNQAIISSPSSPSLCCTAFAVCTIFSGTMHTVWSFVEILESSKGRSTQKRNVNVHYVNRKTIVRWTLLFAHVAVKSHAKDSQSELKTMKSLYEWSRSKSRRMLMAERRSVFI